MGWQETGRIGKRKGRFSIVMCSGIGMIWRLVLRGDETGGSYGWAGEFWSRKGSSINVIRRLVSGRGGSKSVLFETLIRGNGLWWERKSGRKGTFFEVG